MVKFSLMCREEKRVCPFVEDGREYHIAESTKFGRLGQIVNSLDPEMHQGAIIGIVGSYRGCFTTYLSSQELTEINCGFDGFDPNAIMHPEHSSEEILKIDMVNHSSGHIEVINFRPSDIVLWVPLEKEAKTREQASEK